MGEEKKEKKNRDDQVRFDKNGGVILLYVKRPGVYATSARNLTMMLGKYKGFLYMDTKAVNDQRIKEFNRKKGNTGIRN